MLKRVYISIVVALLIFFPVFSGENFTENDWKKIQTCDTLNVFLNNQNAGKLYNSLLVKEGKVENTAHLITKTADHNGNMVITIEVLERRLYTFDGKLFSAYQELSSPAGKNFWTLTRLSSGDWSLSVNAGGVENRKKITDVKDEILSLMKLYSGIFNGTVKVGDSWNDTTLELTSGENVSELTLCKEIPSSKNNFTWQFICHNSAGGSDDKWILDSKGRTLLREMFQFTAKKIDGSSDTASSANLFEAFHIAKTKRPAKGDVVYLTFDSSLSLDASVSSFYIQNGKKCILRKMEQECTDSVDGTSVIVDSLKKYLQSTPTMQTDQKPVIELARTLQGNMKPGCRLVKTFNDYVFKSLRKQNTATFSSALETLKAGFGDCGEHSVLLAALLRAVGIPARVVMGMVYVESKGGYYYHAWVMVYLNGKWIFSDPSHGVFPAGLDRIPLVIDDSGEKILQLSKMVGRVKLEYVPK